MIKYYVGVSFQCHDDVQRMIVRRRTNLGVESENSREGNNLLVRVCVVQW